jgi:polyhydroxyalkanoate synthesis regulator phasin
MPITARGERGKIAKGTAGRTSGSRNRRPRVADLVNAVGMNDMVRALHAKALEGDAPAAKLLLDRLDPAPKLARIRLVGSNATARTPEQALQLAGEALAAATRGELGLDEARAVVTATRELAAIHAVVVDRAEIDALRREVDELKALLTGPGTIQALPGE